MLCSAVLSHPRGIHGTDASISRVIDIGKIACSGLRSEIGLGPVVQRVMANGYNAKEASSIVAAAANNMCRDTIPYINATLNSPPAPPPQGEAVRDQIS